MCAIFRFAFNSTFRKKVKGLEWKGLKYKYWSGILTRRKRVKEVKWLELERLGPGPARRLVCVDLGCICVFLVPQKKVSLEPIPLQPRSSFPETSLDLYFCSLDVGLAHTSQKRLFEFVCFQDGARCSVTAQTARTYDVFNESNV